MNAVAVLAYVVGAAGILFVAPLVLFCLRPDVLRARFESGPDDMDAVAPHAAKDVIAELRRMGFRALGVKVEKTPLRPRVRELSFIAGDGRCYASVAGRGSRLYYYTPFPAGGLVLTSNGAFPRISSTTVAQRSFPRCGVQELLKRHYEALSLLGQPGQVLPTQEARLEATYAYYQTPEVRQALLRAGLFVLAWVGLGAWVLLRWR
jgi:hypothetical protein